MNWQVKIGLGITLVLGLLPFTGLALPHWVTWPGIVVGILLTVLGLLPKHEDIATGVSLLFIAGVAGIVASVILYLDSGPDSLPGFGSFAYIRLYDTAELRRRFIYDFTTPQGGGIKFFLSSSGQFTFSATDVSKEAYSLEIPVGSEGIPIDRMIFLFCEIGISDSRSVLRVTVDTKEVGHRVLPFRIDLGDTSKIGGGAIGADLGRQNSAPFKIGQFGILKATLTKTQKTKMIEAVTKYNAGVPSR
jgi:hypothetical protein